MKKSKNTTKYIRFADRVQRVISFMARTAAQLQIALINLLTRYRIVRLERKLINGLYVGQFIVIR